MNNVIKIFKYKVFFLAFFLCFSVGLSQSVVEVVTINVTEKGLIPDVDTRTAEIAVSQKATLGLYNFVELPWLFKNYIKLDEINKYIIKAEAENGESVVFSFAETENGISKLPPILILEKMKGKTGDTLVIHDKKGKGGKLDIAELEKEAKKIYHYRMILQIKDRKAVRSKIGPYTLIFPQDVSVNRWLKNVKKMKLLMVK